MRIKKLKETTEAYKKMHETAVEYYRQFEKGLEVIMEFFDVVPQAVENDLQASIMLNNLISDPEPIVIYKQDSNSRYPLYNDVFLQGEQFSAQHLSSMHVGERSMERIRYVFLAKMVSAVHDYSCFDMGSTFCRRELNQRILCKNCYNDYLYSHKDYEPCLQCRAIISDLQAEKTKKTFCAVCKENRLLQAYQALCYYINIFDLKTLWKRSARFANYRSFIGTAVSLLLYEKELLKDGWGYAL